MNFFVFLLIFWSLFSCSEREGFADDNELEELVAESVKEDYTEIWVLRWSLGSIAILIVDERFLEGEVWRGGGAYISSGPTFLAAKEKAFHGFTSENIWAEKTLFYCDGTEDFAHVIVTGEVSDTKVVSLREGDFFRIGDEKNSAQFCLGENPKIEVVEEIKLTQFAQNNINVFDGNTLINYDLRTPDAEFISLESGKVYLVAAAEPTYIRELGLRDVFGVKEYGSL